MPFTRRLATNPSVDMLSRPSDVNGFTNAAMAWMLKSVYGADGRLANCHGSPS